MRVTKDEARIISAGLYYIKYELSRNYDIENLFEKIEELEQKMYNFSHDKRLKSNEWQYILHRFVTKKSKDKK